MSHVFRTVAALVAGAAAMYYLDPQQGRRRRAQARDQMTAGTQDLGDYVDAKRRQRANRARGMAQQPNSDRELHERIRASLGHLVASPEAIDVEVFGDYVCLRGHILAAEVQAVIAAIRAMSGVHRIDNELSVHDSADNVPELQGSWQNRS